ncbi:MAG: flagellar hook-associated protein FlgK [Burkholderiales bacterium]|nr:flagellar hook-associated protein FlgK [Burkholderiales bacterium]
MSTIAIGLSGLRAAQTAIATTSHNISNAGTPGFSRQGVTLATNLPQYTSTGFIGQGVSAAAVTRSYSGFLEVQAREAQTQNAQTRGLAERLGALDRVLSDPSTGIGAALDGFMSAVNTAAAQPGDVAARRTLISGADLLAARFRDTAAQVAGLRGAVNDQLDQSVAGINAITVRLAELNDRITEAMSLGTQPPNDLLDTRDAMLRSLSDQLRVSAVPLADGALNVFLSNGQALVLGARSFDLATQADIYDPRDRVVGVQISGTFRPFDEAALSGGALGGALAFRREALDPAENALGRMALGFAEAVNEQHGVGVDRAGALGGALFGVGTPQAYGRSGNTGNAQLNATVIDAGLLTTSDYRIDYDGANYNVLRLADGQRQSFAALPASFDGVAVSLASGSMNVGDSFEIQPSRGAALSMTTLIRDPARVAAALPVRGAIDPANGGAGSLRVAGVTPPAGVNLTQTVSITFTSPTTFDVSGTGTGNPTGLTYTPGMTIAYNGWSARLDGVIVAGDRFSVGANVGGSGDNGNLLALAGLDRVRLFEGGTATVGDAFAQLVASVGNQAHAAEIGASAQGAVLDQANAAVASIAGVNLDEEAANLIKHQQAYQAAGRVIATANEMFDEILAILR